MLYLKEIEQTDGQDVYEMFQEIPKVEPGFENKANGMSEKEFEEYKKKLIGHSKGKGLEGNETQKIDYIAYDSRYPVGTIALRLKLNEYWRKHSGNIGYAVRPSERGKGYGAKMLDLVLKEAKKKGLKEVYLQCNKKNIGSQKVIENNGGVRVKEGNSIYYVIKLNDGDN